ncbi:MAG: cupin domain-containing protein [Caldimonas sp.]
MMTTTFAEFEAAALAEGYDAVVERRWAPGDVVETHGHPFAARARVVEGEMWLTRSGETRRLLPGDTFVLARDEPHAERYGSDGATYWVARRGA